MGDGEPAIWLSCPAALAAGPKGGAASAVNKSDSLIARDIASAHVGPASSSGTDRGLGLIQRAYFQPVLEQLAASGVPVERHLRHAGLAEFAMDEFKSFVPAHSVIAFLERLAACELSEDPVGDLEHGYRLSNTAHYGQALLSSRSLLAAAAPGDAVISYNTLDLQINGPTATIFDRYHRERGPGERILEGLLLILLLDAMVAFGGRNCRPIRFGFTGGSFPRHSVPIDLSHTVIRFGQPENSVTFPSRWLANAPRLPLPRPEAVHWAPDESVSARPRELFCNLRPDVRPTLKLLAETSGIAPRTLRRRLANEGTGFFGLLDTWRFETALRLLEVPRKGIGEIAKEIGYRDPAHFTRAFRRWTGQAPAAYRQNLLNS